MTGEDGRGSGNPAAEHSIILTNRESLNIQGVHHVDSFDDHEIILATQLGKLTIKGKNMRIKQLDLDEGNFVVEGHVDSFAYSEGGRESPKSKNLINRILR